MSSIATATKVRPLAGALARLLFWLALCTPTLLTTWRLVDFGRGWQALVWAGAATAVLATLPARAFVVTRWIAVLALPALLWWIGYAALNGIGPGWEAAAAAAAASPREIIEAAALVAGTPGFVLFSAATVLLLLASLVVSRWAHRKRDDRGKPFTTARQAVLAAALTPFAFSGVTAAASLPAPILFLPSDSSFSLLGTALRLVDEGIDRAFLDGSPSRHAQRRSAAPSHQVTQPLLAVFVIGESIRADSLGPQQVDRGPWTRALDERLTHGLGTRLPDTCAGANGTHASVPMLLTATPAQRYADAATAPSVLAALKAAGFATAWLSNQDTSVFAEAGHNYYWTVSTTASLSGAFDEDLVPLAAAFAAPLLRADASTAKPRALVAHTMGSHFDYRQRYPAHLFPPEPDGLSASRLLSLRYSRAVEYTASVLGRWAELLDRAAVPAFLVFSGDHGENLPGDANGLTAHLGPRASLRDGTTTSLVLWNRAMAASGRPTRALALLQAAPMIAHVDVAHAFLALADVADSPVRPLPEPMILAPVVVGGPSFRANACSRLMP